MLELTALWLPIVASAVIVFFASAIIWMVLPIHNKDYGDPRPAQAALLDAIKASGLKPGMYSMPFCEHGKDKSPEVEARLKSGPWAVLTIMRASPKMGAMLGLWMLHLLIVTTVIAYVATLTGMVPGENYMRVFRVVGSTALLAHAGYALPLCIWHSNPWHTLPAKLFDGVVYALLTAGTFGWLWPKAAAAISGG